MKFIMFDWSSNEPIAELPDNFFCVENSFIYKDLLKYRVVRIDIHLTKKIVMVMVVKV